MGVLITGGTGFIGAHLARRLVRAGQKVVLLDPSPVNVLQEILTPEELGAVIVVPGHAESLRDLGEAIRTHRVDRIAHLASLLHPACDLNPPQAVQVNVGSHLAVLEAARLWDLKKVVWASSVEDIARPIEYYLRVERTRTLVFNTRFDVRSIREVGSYITQLLPGAQIEYFPGTFGLAWELDDSALQAEIGFRPDYPVERGVLETINDVRRRHGLLPVARH
ncbi:MAG: NAD(P)-dependent oxidoreductase [Armatimonadota bacterium]|nr:NAD(P)-dependent oxidoreductase [Armatimonadota bacterium]MDR7463159.1 NAD(P)-dependent oxidoreductase [Armatimonadota bacterium]MDR7468854.1 NAD(P)-dependent oxidoreductase [Armatimonadota bacterium]MDR7475404.1 NAD(P)-dependent oxidoreductase [Armatimonadota bacterium]MDR7540499.1 NAD(P)-dependent oxidoreductase [Armatimonadota bacterium]